MKIVLFLSILLLFTIPQQNSATDDSSIAVLEFRWSKSHRTMEKRETNEQTSPASAMTPADKNFARNVRVNDPMGVRDPNADTLDGRSAQMEKNVQDARTPAPQRVEGYTYRTKVQNNGPNAVEAIFWEYQFEDSLSQENLTRHQFLCVVNIRGGKAKELEGFSVSSPSSVVNVDTLAKNEGKPYKEKIVINRVEYANGAIWQRTGWSLKDVKAAYDRALKESWTPGMCKNL